MELLDRYLQAVKKHLPWQRQDDIIAELKANMESQHEDQEAELGRPLTTGEQEDWLRRVGPPMLVAARYRPQQYLIGPAIFPIYWYVLRMAFLWATVIYSIVTAVLIVTQTPTGTAVLTAILRVPGVLITVAAWVTGVFAVIEFATIRYPHMCPAIPGFSAPWNPSTLPPLEKQPATGRKPRSYAQAVAEIVFGFLFLGWFVLVPQYPYLMFGPGAAYFHASPYQLGAVWITFFWWVVVLNLVQLVWSCINLWRGSWQHSSAIKHFVVKTISLIPIVLMLNVADHAYVLLKHPAQDQLRYAANLNSINNGIHIGLQVICAIAVLQLVWDIAQLLLASYRKRATAR